MNLFGLGKPDVKKLKLKNDVEGLIKVLENSRVDDDTRQDAAAAIGDIGGAKEIDLLIHNLENDDFKIRYLSVIALGRTGDERVINPLVRMLDDEEWKVRSTATIVLAFFGEQKGNSAVVEPLLQALKDHDKSVRKVAMNALNKKKVKSLSKDQARVERFVKATELFEKGRELTRKALNKKKGKSPSKDQAWEDSISALEEVIQLRPDFAYAREILEKVRLVSEIQTDRHK